MKNTTFIEGLKRHNIDYVLGQDFDTPKEIRLKDRVDKYNNAECDIVLSFHADYNNNRANRGHWCFYWHNSSDAKRLAQLWDKYADKLLPNPDRNIYPCTHGEWSDFYMNRETNMVALTIEHGFFSNQDDRKLLKSDVFRRLSAEVAVRAVCDYFNIEYIELDKLDSNEGSKNLEIESLKIKVKLLETKLQKINQLSIL